MPTIEEWRERYHRNHPKRALLMDEIRMAWDGGDPFGSAVANMFAIADVLWHHDDSEVPDRWTFEHRYCQGVDRESYPDAMFDDLLRAGTIDVDALVYAGDIMDRVVDRCKMAGLAY